MRPAPRGWGFQEQPSLYLMVRGKDRISLSVDKDGKTHVEGVTPPPEGR
ncbi:hypothetical protein [Corallococcus sp. CA053C]|nr:hypothetical protein [Corallococcus sp. CA053C]